MNEKRERKKAKINKTEYFIVQFSTNFHIRAVLSSKKKALTNCIKRMREIKRT